MTFEEKAHAWYQELLTSYSDLFQSQHNIDYVTDPHQISEWEQKPAKSLACTTKANTKSW